MEKMNEKQIQQGDVWFERIDVLPEGAEEVKGHTFAEGEGHHEHVGVPGAVKLFRYNDKTYARFLKPTQIKHVRKGGIDGGEHNALEVLQPGDYEYGQVLEYDYLSRMARKVVD